MTRSCARPRRAALFTDEELSKQIQYAIDNGWAVAVEFTDDPHPRNFLWDMWGLPMFEIADAAAGLYEVNECRKAYPTTTSA